jgi:hypothetical protein
VPSTLTAPSVPGATYQKNRKKKIEKKRNKKTVQKRFPSSNSIKASVKQVSPLQKNKTVPVLGMRNVALAQGLVSATRRFSSAPIPLGKW